jgi:hypothetical protein
MFTFFKAWLSINSQHFLRLNFKMMEMKHKARMQGLSFGIRILVSRYISRLYKTMHNTDNVIPKLYSIAKQTLGIALLRCTAKALQCLIISGYL